MKVVPTSNPKEEGIYPKIKGPVGNAMAYLSCAFAKYKTLTNIYGASVLCLRNER